LEITMPARLSQRLRRAPGAVAIIFLVLTISACSPKSRGPENNDIVVREDGSVLLNGRPVSCAALQTRFRARQPDAKSVPPCNQLLLRELRSH
jgi:hypothetical protein